MVKPIKAVTGAAQKPEFKVKNKALLSAVRKALDGIVQHERGASGKYATAGSAVNAFALKEYGEEGAPWFVLTYDKLPDALRKEYESFTEELKGVGHSNPSGMWGRVRDAAAKEALVTGSWVKYKERVAEQAARQDRMLEANRAAKAAKAEAAKAEKAKAPASAPRVQSIPSGKPTAEQAATATAPEMTQAEVIAKLAAPEQALAAFAIGIRTAVQKVKDTPEADPVLVATAKAVAVAFEAIAPKVAELERKINRLRTGSSK
jgi:hypothetical protein